MLHSFSFPCSNHMLIPSPSFLNTTPFQLTHQSLSVSFPRRPLSLRALRSVLPANLNDSAPCFDLPRGEVMSPFIDIELKVRDYELDQFGVVNNAVYSSYCQHGHHELCERIGLNVESVVRGGDALAVAELSLRFLAPLRSGDKFVHKVRIAGYSAACLYFDHFILKLPNHEPILKAKAKGVWLDKNYHPIRLPAEMKSKFAKFIRSDQF